MKRIGVISDTHGLLREEVRKVLQGCDIILHGGDIHNETVIKKLQEIASLYVVRGNVDKEWAKNLPKLLEVELFGIRIKMIHNIKELPQDLGAVDLVIYGHSHKYVDQVKNGIRFLNPGSCGPKRFYNPITMALIEVAEDRKYEIKRIDILQEQQGAIKMPKKEQDRRKMIKVIMRAVDKGQTVEQIAHNNHIDVDLAEQICRMYLTHPGVDVDGILDRIRNC